MLARRLRAGGVAEILQWRGVKMNILFFNSNAIAPDRGGIERWTDSICVELEKRGNACFYLAAKPVWKEFADPVRQSFLPNSKNLCCRANAEFFEELLVEKKIDRVLFLWADGKRFPFAKICRELRIPVIAAIHTDPEFYLSRFRGNGVLKKVKRFLRFRRQAKIYKHNADCCAVTVLLSPNFIPEFLRHFPAGKSSGKIVAIPNMCASSGEQIDFSAKKKELLFVGRMEMSVKQPQLLLQIWKNLQDRFPDWTLRMVGGAHDFEKVKELARTLELKRVFFEGFQKPQKYYRDAAIFCLTSAYEGFPSVLVEAADGGCALVAFESFASVHDIIDDGENGVLVPAFDLEKYAEKLAELMSDPELRERLAMAAHAGVRRFSKERITDIWLNLLEEVGK